MDPIAVRITRRAVVNRAGPSGKAGRVGFAAEEVYVLLTHKEVRVVDWVWAVGRLVIGYGYRRRVRRTKRGAAWTAETDRETFVAFSVRVVDQRHRKRLERFTCSERHRAERVDVIATRRSNAVKDVAVLQARGVICRISNAGRGRCIADPRHGDIRAARGFANKIICRTELHAARGRRGAELAANLTIQEIAAVNVDVQQSALQVLHVGRGE